MHAHTVAAKIADLVRRDRLSIRMRFRTPTIKRIVDAPNAVGALKHIRKIISSMCAAAPIASRLARTLRLTGAGDHRQTPVQSNERKPLIMYHNGKRECPRCEGAADRVQRRLIDRIISLILPRRRYRCESRGCGWEGNLPPRSRSLRSRT